MKKILTFLLTVSFSALIFAEDLTSPKKLDFHSVWARTGEISMNATDDADVKCLKYSGYGDFCATYSQAFDVKPGEVYQMSGEFRMTGQGTSGISVIMRQGKKTHEWVYGSRTIYNATYPEGEFQRLTTKFIIPQDRNSIVPRIVGYGNCDDYQIYFRNITIQKVGEISLLENAPQHMMENDSLKVTFDGQTAAFQVQDKRTGRIWKQATRPGQFYVKKSSLKDNKVTFTAINAKSVEDFTVEISLSKTAPELTVKLVGAPEMNLDQPISYPSAFESVPQDRIIIPINEGISFPVTEDAPGAGHLVAYGGHGICMGFWAQCEEEFVPAPNTDENTINQLGEVRGKSGYLAILETSDDVRITTSRPDENTLLTTTLEWQGQKGKLGYDRVIRYVFFDKADVTTVVKRYRAYADTIGLVVPFTEKVKRNPALKEGFDLLIGSANFWYFGGNKIKLYKELQAEGVTKILSSSGGTAEEIREMNAMPGILTSRYDIYQDSMDPTKYEAVGRKPGDYGLWTSEAWERDELMTDKNGNWIRGWEVAQVDKTKPRIPCGVLCDVCAVPYERVRVAKELAEKPYRARFLDTTTASSWRECYHPKHPCTRTESKNAKMELLGVLGREFNLVAGSETGHEASVPYCDFYEGMMSLGPYRVPDSGRNLLELWEEGNVPERTEKYQVGETYRMPLWELVYHDCTVSYWYWGDYNNKLPSLWVKRDLFNALYGVPPMYLFDGKTYPRFKKQIIASYKIAQPVSEKTGWHEMTAFRVLSKDRTVQQTEFANGIRVTVNFGDNDCTLADGYVLKAKTVRVEENVK